MTVSLFIMECLVTVSLFIMDYLAYIFYDGDFSP